MPLAEGDLERFTCAMADGILRLRCVQCCCSWRDGRAAEGAPLLREYGVKSSIEGSNPSLSAI